MNEPHRHHPDLDAVLAGVPPEEAERLRAVWHLAGDEEPTAFPTEEAAQAALLRLETALDRPAVPTEAAPADRRPQRRRAAPPARRTLWRLGAAAAVLLLLVLAGQWLWQRPVVQTAAPGERLALTLPDGSSVELNSGSTLRYDRRFGEVRAVHLEGEAFFDVAEEQRPFLVRTFNTQVQVLGTRFNMRAWSEGLEQSTTVTLASGSIALMPAGRPDRAVVMVPGETRRVAAAADPMDLVDSVAVSVEEATAWRRGDFFFNNQFLGALLEDVERRFGVDLEVKPESLLERRMGGALRQPEDAEAVIRDLAAVLGLRYRETATGYELYSEAP